MLLTTHARPARRLSVCSPPYCRSWEIPGTWGYAWRALLRLAGGDGNAILGILGLIVGIWIGALFLKGGYNLGRTRTAHTTVGWLLPLTVSGSLILMFIFPQVKGEAKNGVLFY